MILPFLGDVWGPNSAPLKGLLGTEEVMFGLLSLRLSVELAGMLALEGLEIRLDFWRSSFDILICCSTTVSFSSPRCTYPYDGCQ